ncbi:MAG: tetratricopeptide repeat protein [Flavobacteriaceae bacterium]|jgi:tetratricopeptide (TPR) repeat protein|nr:tetratricopeptide repeat protein [Flavobacteriaceae bacterium]
MKFLVCLFFSIFCLVASAQVDPALAQDYFEKGSFEKALSLYKKLLKSPNPRTDYAFKLIECHQQLSQFNDAQKQIETLMRQSDNPLYLVELGYNFQLQNQPTEASSYYEKALQAIETKPNYVYSVAQRFEKYSRIESAIQSYEIGLKNNINAVYYFQLAGLYAEQQNIDKMMECYLDYAEINSAYVNRVMRFLSDYISEDASQPYNQLFKKVLLRKSQAAPNILWNQWLSWLYIQQNEFNKAFVQVKAIYRRNPESLQGLINLAESATEASAFETALSVYQFLIQNATDTRLVIQANCKFLELQLKYAQSDYATIKDRYETLLDGYQLGMETIDLQLSYAQFLSFYDSDSQAAIRFLKSALKANLSDLASAQLKMKLADILVTQNKFNQALIYYTQIQMRVKNSPLSQEARFKAAKTSYYKGDFDWAEAQLKVLKSSSSQLTANDALELQLLISDHKGSDSLHTALKSYVKADLLISQNNPTEAIAVLDTILKTHKTDPIIDQTLLVQAQLYTSQNDYQKAEANYLRIITDFKTDILVDDAYFYLAELYRTQLKNTDKALLNYESIIFNHVDSIHFVEARKQYRFLRGDAIN